MQNVNDINTVNDDNISVIIGNNIVKLLNRDKLSVSAACDMNKERHLNIARQTLSKAIKGETELNITQLLDICQFFGVSLDYLMGKTPYTNPDARAAGEYIGLCPESVEVLHKYRFSHSVSFLDFMLAYYTQNIFDLLHQLGSICALHSETEIYTTLNPDTHTDFIEFFMGTSPTEKDKKDMLEQKENLMKTMQGIYDTIAPVLLLAWHFNKSYYRQLYDSSFNDDQPLTPDQYKAGREYYSKLEKAYNEDKKALKQRKVKPLPFESFGSKWGWFLDNEN